MLLLEPSPLHAARVFCDRTIGYQFGRESPFSLWDWRQYHAKGMPDLHLVQSVLEVLLVRRRDRAVALAAPALAAPARGASRRALLIGFELVLTHWFFLYLPWFFPFVAIALLSERPPPEPVAEPADEHAEPVLVAT